MKLYCPNCGNENQDSNLKCIFCDTILSRFNKGGLLTPGLVLYSKYQIVRQINQGKLSSIYCIKDVKEKTLLILKELHCITYSKSQKEYLLKRFAQEIELLMKLKHPNLPAVVDSFNLYGRYYLVMDYIEGYDLQYLLSKSSNKSIPEKLVVKWAIQLCDVLNYLHRLNIIHRDIKPSNIMVREKDGKIFLVDFGLARVIETEKELTKTAVGTEGYIPPEQYAGTPVPASDIYSLGVTLHHLVTGEFPFVPFIFKPIRNLNAGLSIELEAIIEKCINLKLEERYSSALTLKRDLMLVKASLTSTKLNKSDGVRPEKPKFTKILKPEQKKYSIPLEITERVSALDSDVAQKMLRSIETLSRSNVLPYLIQMMHNKDVEVRRAVATALGGLKDNNAVGYLVELLRDNDSQVRQLAAWGLGESKDKRALHPLLEALMTGDADLRGGAALALGELKDREAVSPLIDTFSSDPEPMVRKRAVRAISEIGDRSALPYLVNRLEKENEEPLKQTISWAIKQLQ